MNGAIETCGLTKRFGERLALDNLSLAVTEGVLFGFLGPNGAGKTTTIRILLGLLHASAGEARVAGRDVWHDGPRARAEIGYLPGDVRFYDQLTGRATLSFIDAARGGRCRTELRRLADAFDLPLDRRVRKYSRGMKQKLGLIVAMMHRPRVLILDEPTTALDPLVRETLFAELRAAARDGRTVFFSSHTLSEVEDLCDEVGILRGGRLIVRERIETLRARAVRRVRLRFDPAHPPQTPPEFKSLGETVGRIEGSWTGDSAALLTWLSNTRLLDFAVAPPDLEDLFLAYYTPEPGGGP